MNLWVSLLFLNPLLGLQDGPMTLEQAIKIAEGNSFALKTAKTNVEKARLRIDEAHGAAGPKLNATATYTRFDKANPSFAPEPNPIDQKSLDIVLRYPIDLAGALRRATKGARAGLQAQVATYVAAQNDLRLTVSQSFLQVLQAAETVKVARESLARAQERLEITKKELAQGVRARVDVIRLEASVQEAQTNLIAAENGLALSSAAFNNALGRPIVLPVALAEPSFTAPPEQADEELMKMAREKRPELEALRQTTVLLKYTREVTEGGMTPSLDVIIQNSNQLGSIGPFSRRNATTGLIQLGIPIWDSGITRARVKSARQDEEAAKIALEQTQLLIDLEVKQAKTNLINAAARIASAQKNLDLARENFRLTSLRFDNQEGIALEVADANTQLTAAQVSLVNARYDFFAAIAALERALGARIMEGNK